MKNLCERCKKRKSLIPRITAGNYRNILKERIEKCLCKKEETKTVKKIVLPF